MCRLHIYFKEKWEKYLIIKDAQAGLFNFDFFPLEAINIDEDYKGL